MSENKDFIGEMSVLCQQYNDTYVRDGRIHEGIVKVMHATAMLGGGRAAIGAAEIATVGFLKGMDLIFGTSSMVFGAAEGTEGIQDITYASLGELDMESQNVIKSMLGDKAYHNLMYVSEVGANVSALASVLNYRLVENAMYAGTPDVERLEAGGSQANVRTEPVNDVLPEENVTGETSGGEAIKSGSNSYSGEEWCRYFREIYGNNVTWENATPSQLARSWQGSGKYIGIDEYTDVTVNKGTILYRGEPNGTEYFTTLDAIEQSGRSATTIFEGLQVEKNPIHGYRDEMQGYLFNEDVASAYGITNANPQFGNGGLPQYYVPDVQDLISKGILTPVDNIKLDK